jgi:4-diphosphocytidyl-2-C-methyl-D-erythritol kinase
VRYEALIDALAPRGGLPGELVVNDLQPAALSLCPSIAEALEAVRDAGAEHALVSGSGPTVVGIWWGEGALFRATEAARTLAPGWAGAVAAYPVAAEYGLPSLI